VARRPQYLNGWPCGKNGLVLWTYDRMSVWTKAIAVIVLWHVPIMNQPSSQQPNEIVPKNCSMRVEKGEMICWLYFNKECAPRKPLGLSLIWLFWICLWTHLFIRMLQYFIINTCSSFAHIIRVCEMLLWCRRRSPRDCSEDSRLSRDEPSRESSPVQRNHSKPASIDSEAVHRPQSDNSNGVTNVKRLNVKQR